MRAYEDDEATAYAEIAERRGRWSSRKDAERRPRVGCGNCGDDRADHPREGPCHAMPDGIPCRCLSFKWPVPPSDSRHPPAHHAQQARLDGWLGETREGGEPGGVANESERPGSTTETPGQGNVRPRGHSASAPPGALMRAPIYLGCPDCSHHANEHEWMRHRETGQIVRFCHHCEKPCTPDERPEVA